MDADDINLRCRTCFEKAGNFHPLEKSSIIFPEKKLSELLWEVANIDSTNYTLERMPKNMCSKCQRKLNDAYYFVLQAQRVNERLLRIINAREMIAESDGLLIDGGKRLDCLVEAPIDVIECMQVKMEADYIEENIIETINMPMETIDELCIENAVQYLQKGGEDDGVSNCDEVASGSNSAYCSVDPIVMSHLDYDDDYNLDADAESESETSKSSKKRGRDGARSNKARYNCNACEKSFAWKKDLLRHENIHSSNRIEYQCDQCERKFLRKDKLKNHLKTHVKNETLEVMKSTKQEVKANRSKEEKPEEGVADDFGNDVLHSDAADITTADWQTSTENAAAVEKEVSSKRRRESPSKSVGNRYKCNDCEKTFAWKKDLYRHENTHFGEPEHQCEYCERKFMRKDKLKDHIKTHLKQKNLLETSAQQRTVSQTAINFGERIYAKQPLKRIQCKLCDTNFTNTHELREHIYTHIDPITLEQLELHSDTVKELFPQIQNIDDIKNGICKDIAVQRLGNYYNVINEYGYEMSLSDSDIDDDHYNSDLQPAAANNKYVCEQCLQKFAHKHEIFTHCVQEHLNTALPYKCIVCKLEFVCEQMFSEHTKTHCRSKIKKYQCLKCPGKFRWLENLEAHVCSNRFNTAEYKAKREILQCHICDKTFVGSSDLKRHMSTHDAAGVSHECSYCYQQFLKAENLRQHLRQIHGEELTRLMQCYLCHSKCQKLAELRQHLQQHADGQTGIDMQHGQFFSTYYADGCNGREHEIAQSIITDFGTNNLVRYYRAIDESGNELDLSDSETDTEDENETANIMDNAKYACELCGQGFARRKRILRHQYSEHSDSTHAMLHSCSECPKQFVCLSLLEHHLKRDCLNAFKKYQCDKCSARFVWQENLDLHQQLKHINTEQQINRQLANQLQCEQCDKVFIWAKDLTRHKRMHMPDDEKYKCTQCERKFHRKDNLNAHMKKHGEQQHADAQQHNQTVAAAQQQPARSKATKVKELDENLCKSNGCKSIQCMICLSNHSKIADLRTHLSTHQYAVSFAQRQQSIEEISTQLYPELPIMLEQALIERIKEDVTAQRMDHLYSITNEVGYELSLNSSETESDSDDDDAVLASTQQRYTCDLCKIIFVRKYKLFEHQMSMHEWQEAKYACRHCNMRFLCEPLLQQHYEQQCKNVQKRFICRKCPYRFMWKENLQMHTRTMHTEHEDKKKMPESNPSPFVCLECERSFRMRKDLSRHMLIHRADTYIFNCLWCSRKFYRLENMQLHMRRHGITPDCYETAECIIKATVSANGPKEICCKICNIKFNSIAALRTHLSLATTTTPTATTLAHHSPNSMLNYSITNSLGFELNVNDSDTDEESPEKTAVGGDTIKLEEQKPSYTCAICNLPCKRKYEMTQHQRAMHKYEELPFKCDKCIFRTVSQYILTHHMVTQCYNSEKPLKCSKCSFKFMWQNNLDTHMQLIHNSDSISKSTIATTTNSTTTKNMQSAAVGTAAPETRIFQCNQCHCKYTRKDRLNAHIKRVHVEGVKLNEAAEIDPATGKKMKKTSADKKFLCAFCGRAVTSSSNLIIHMRRHTGEKPFKCEFCDMGFPRSSDLQCHRRKHTGEKPHKCTVCQKAFSRSYKLQTHMRIHSGIKPYKCTYCEKSFTQSNDLTLHIRRHTGERPYVCGICGERFIQGSALKSHRTMRGHYEDIEPRRTLLME